MKLLDINSTQIQEMHKMGMSLDHFWVLHAMAEDMYPVCLNRRITKLLEDRGLIAGTSLTAPGRFFYDKIKNTSLDESPKKGRKKEAVVTDNGFEDWWCTYPSTDSFKYRGMPFPGEGRSLKTNKEVCRMKYTAIISKGDVSPDTMLEALKVQLEKKKAASFDTGKNNLTFFQNAQTYLNQESFRAFLEEVVEESGSNEPENDWA